MPTLKRQLQSVLRRAGLYERVRTSHVYDLYWRFVDKAVIEARQREVAFYKTLLTGFRKGDLVFDIGANHGSKTDVFLRLGARVVAVDPDDLNQDTLTRRFLKLRFTPMPVVVVGKAVSDQKTVATMWIDEPGSAKNTLNRKWVDILATDDKRFGHSLDFAQRKEVQTTTIKDLMETFGRPFFVKIDIEGHELKALEGMHRPVPYLSFEVNLPEFRDEGLACVKRLAQIKTEGTFNYSADCGQGLALERWVTPEEFSRIFQQCEHESIEVFWRTSESVE